VAVAVPAPDPAAQRAALLYECHHAAVLGYCVWRLRTRFDAEEAAQTTFTRALSALRRGHRPRNERAWLVTIARNVCTTLGTAPHRALEIAGDVPQGVLPESDDGLGPELEAALAALPEGQRRALLLREWHELSYREIAAELGVSVGTVESWIFRARRSLASTLGSARRHLGLAGLLRSFGSSAGAKVAAATVLATAVVATEGRTDPGHERAPAKQPVPPRGHVQVVEQSASAVPAAAVPRRSARRGQTVRANPGAPAPTVDTPRVRATGVPAVSSPSAGVEPSAPPSTQRPAPPTTQAPAPTPPAQPEPAPPLPTVQVPEPQLPPLPVPVPSVPDLPVAVPTAPVDVPALPAVPDLSLQPPKLP
jgi:RNA polymerase sigma-70 factor (ECF subfamily)